MDDRNVAEEITAALASRPPRRSGGSRLESPLQSVALVLLVLLVLVLVRLVSPIGAPDHDPATSARELFERGWDDLAAHLALALCELVVLVPAWRHAPSEGARRLVVLAGAVVLASAAAAAARSAWVFWEVGEEWSTSFPIVYRRLLFLTSMLVGVLEFHRRAMLAREAMRLAEASRQRFEQETLQARLATLEAQIEPHFLFNTLATVRRLYETDPAAGRAMLRQLMRYLEVALPALRDDSPTLGRELELVTAYLELHRVRMGKRLDHRIAADRNVLAARIPAFMLLTLVENAIKHGIAPTREGGRVEVTAHAEGDALQIAVADDGSGFAAGTSGGGTGLANIRTRLDAMYGARASLALAQREPRGFVARVRLPLAAVQGDSA